MEAGKLYLIPTYMGNPDSGLIPEAYKEIIHTLQYFVAEHAKSARAFLKSIDTPIPMDELEIEELNKHTDPKLIHTFLQPCLEGKNMGLMSDAGLPCVADPGYQIVRQAHEYGLEVIPMHGLSSIMMTLMASGLNGQSFKFHGYLPHDKKDRKRIFKQCEVNMRHGETQLFIETPYRNRQFVAELKKALPSKTIMVIGVDISMASQEIIRCSLKEVASDLEFLHKRPAVFALGFQ